jgi:hypothetical protein
MNPISISGHVPSEQSFPLKFFTCPICNLQEFEQDANARELEQSECARISAKCECARIWANCKCARI